MAHKNNNSMKTETSQLAKIYIFGYYLVCVRWRVCYTYIQEQSWQRRRALGAEKEFCTRSLYNNNIAVCLFIAHVYCFYYYVIVLYLRRLVCVRFFLYLSSECLWMKVEWAKRRRKRLHIAVQIRSSYFCVLLFGIAAPVHLIRNVIWLPYEGKTNER